MGNNLHKSIGLDPEQEIELYKSILGTLQQTVFLFDRNKNFIEVYKAPYAGKSEYDADTFIGTNIMDYVSGTNTELHDGFTTLNDAFDKLLDTGSPQDFNCCIEGECFESTLSFAGNGYVISHIKNISSEEKNSSITNA